MRVLVSDTSVLIDLERGDLLEAAFSLRYQFVVPDVLFHRELTGELGHRLTGLGLVVAELPGAEIEKALFYRRSHPALSVTDAFALVLAGERGWTLLTGDAVLRRVAERNGVDCHGLLWLLDELESAGVAPRVLRDGLRAIAEHPRCRLPRTEIRMRLRRYAARIGGS